jgi:hypothetical protein
LFDAILNARIQDLWNLYISTGELKHRGEKGLFRELFVRQLLENLLPIQFGVGSGIIIDKWGRQSPQVDLLIFDRRLIPPILHSGGHGVYLMDSVLRVVEVKSLLQKKDLLQFGQLVNSIYPYSQEALMLASSGNLERGFAFYPFATLFAYRSSIKNISRAIEKIPELNLPNNTAPIFIASSKAQATKYDFDYKQVRDFCLAVLGQLEETSISRKHFSLSDWMS